MSRKNSKSDEQGVVFVWGEDDDLFAQETPHEAETGEVEDIPFPSPADSLDNERGYLKPVNVPLDRVKGTYMLKLKMRRLLLC